MMILFRLEEIMAQKGLTYRQVSAGAEVSTNTLYKMAKNKLKMVGIDVIDRLTRFLDCEPGDLIVRTKPNEGS